MSAPLQTASDDCVAAGPFGQWLSQMRASLHGADGTEVPCGDCVGCCVSSYYIPLRPEDHEALARVPERFLADARGTLPGHRMIGYLENGACPMLESGKCSIYPHRPQTCRDYDCRIFAAAGIDAGGADRAVIKRRVRQWRFTYPTDADRQAQRAVQSAAAFIQTKKASFPGGRAPTASTGIAVLAIKVYEVFLDTDIESKSDPDIAAAIVDASRAFDSGA